MYFSNFYSFPKSGISLSKLSVRLGVLKSENHLFPPTYKWFIHSSETPFPPPLFFSRFIIFTLCYEFEEKLIFSTDIVL